MVERFNMHLSMIKTQNTIVVTPMITSSIHDKLAMQRLLEIPCHNQATYNVLNLFVLSDKQEIWNGASQNCSILHLGNCLI
jgi:N-dimethylarginine dimethylaminohydrolase